MHAEPRRARILIGIPCYGDVGPEVLGDYMRFAFHLGRRMPAYDFEIAIPPKMEQFRARNALVEGTFETACDYLLMLDDDMIIDADVSTGVSDRYGFLERLIAHDKDICGVLYYQKQGACAPVLMKQVGEGGGYRFLRDDEVEHRLQRVDVAGGGCLLIKTTVLDHLTHPYFSPEYEYGTDIQLCRKAAEKGFEVWADTSIEFGHVKPTRPIVTSRNRHQFQLEDQSPGEMKRTFVASALYDDLLRDVCAYTGYRDLEEITDHARTFLKEREAFVAAGGSDPEWYKTHPRERIARQTWFNTMGRDKRTMTEYILNVIDHVRPKDILDFGCGIGIPAFFLAQKGHRVTAMDLEGTGTLAFLKDRVRRHRVPMTIAESKGGVPHLGGAEFDVIIAMDCLEHIKEWPDVVRELARHLKPGGVLFSNNAILLDNLHPEHYSLENKAFVEVCMANDLMPFNQITYTKRAPLNAQEGHDEALRQYTKQQEAAEVA